MIERMARLFGDLDLTKQNDREWFAINVVFWTIVVLASGVIVSVLVRSALSFSNWWLAALGLTVLAGIGIAELGRLWIVRGE